MGCVQSVEDTQAAGYQNNERKTHFQADAAAAVAEMLGAGTSTQVEVSVRCRGLPDKDTFSKSDPMCVLYAADSSGKVWTEIDRSDVVANTLNPAFPAPLKVTYSFERLQPMRLVVYDADVRASDSRKLNLNQQDFLAQGPFLLSDLLTAQGQQLTIPLADKSGRTLPRCAAVLLAEEMPNTNAVVQLSLAASKLENKDTWGKSDPFVRISKARENGEWMPVLKTEVVNNNLNPTWKPFKASMSQLCNCDEQRPLLLEVFDSDPGGTHDYIGACQASLRQLKAASASGQGLPLLNSKKASKPGYVSSGTLVVKAANVTPRPSFLDYIRGGCTLNFLVAIDFTASNGDPRNPSSLHHYSDRPTIYEDAISAVGAVLEHYDTDRMFPAFGFGAALPPAGTVSHCFALNGTPSNPEVAGVKGIQDVYRHTLSSVRLSGPTLFAPVINAASQLASQPSSHPEYWVLLILTDGCIMDMADTLASLVNASNLPLSFIIVGVGNADFSAMEALDGDGKRLRAPNGQMAARDCVQFCELRPNQRHTIETVASKLLEELPGQVVEYFHDMCRIPPPAAATPPPAVSAPSTPPEPAAAFPAPAQQAASFAMPTPPPATAAAPPAASQDPYYPKI